jgi:adenosine deaminase
MGRWAPSAGLSAIWWPVALATDDEGVSRSDLTHEYLRAVEAYEFLGYKDLKRMARMSLEHGFLAGSSLWASDFRLVAACANDRAGAGKVSAVCQKFLDGNERAKIQWSLEEEFAGFEKKF